MSGKAGFFIEGILSFIFKKISTKKKYLNMNKILNVKYLFWGTFYSIWKAPKERKLEYRGNEFFAIRERKAWEKNCESLRIDGNKAK